MIITELYNDIYRKHRELSNGTIQVLRELYENDPLMPEDMLLELAVKIVELRLKVVREIAKHKEKPERIIDRSHEEYHLFVLMLERKHKYIIPWPDK